MSDDWRKHPDLPTTGSVLCRLDKIPGGGHVLAFGDSGECVGEGLATIPVCRCGDAVCLTT